MVRQNVAQASVTSQHLQQGLWLMLALLVTLIAGQQFARLSDNATAAQSLPSHTTGAQHFTQVSATARTAAKAQQVDRVVEPQDVPQQPRWVF